MPTSERAHAKKVAEVMSHPLIFVSPRTPAYLAEDVARLAGVRHLVVLEGGALVGVVCACDLWAARAGGPVGACMSAPALTIDAEASILEASERMLDRGVGCLPVLAGGEVAGIITRGDLRRAGVPVEPMEGRCLACGSEHHLPRVSAVPQVPFCRECLDRSTPPPPSDDLGDGD